VTCSSCEDLFERYLDDTLAPAQRARVLTHLRQCGRCKGILEELRVIDALLVAPRTVALPENFTFATMAEIRSLPRPYASTAPVVAYVVSYLVAAWLLIAAGFLLAGSAMRAFGETALDAGAHVMRLFGAVGDAAMRILGDFSSLGAVVGAAILIDVALIVAVIVGLRLVGTRYTERLRS
jgi:anti-sigma factor RsiW